MDNIQKTSEQGDEQQLMNVAKGFEKVNNGKTYNMPEIHKNAIGKGGMYESMGLSDTIRKVNLKQLMDDNDLWNDVALSNRNRPKTWDSELEKKIGNGDFIYGSMDDNGKIVLGDGRHRVRALFNSGYDSIEMPVKNWKELKK